MSEFSRSTFAEAITALDLAQNQRTWRSCVVTSANFRIGETWIPLFTHIRYDRGSLGVVRDPVIFGRLELREESRDPTGVLRILMDSGFDQLGPHPHLFQTQGHWQVIVPDQTWHDWYPLATPAYILTRRGNVMPGEPGSDLYTRIAHEVREAIIEGEGRMHFATAIDAIDWWLPRRVTVANNDVVSTPVMEVIFPLPSGHVKSVRDERGYLCVDLEPFESPVAMEAHLAFRDEDTDEHVSESLPVINDNVRYQRFPKAVYSIEVRSNGQLVSFFRGNVRHLPRPVGGESEQALLQRLLFWGEREACEFKDLGNRKTGSPNWEMLNREIPKSAGAMANTNGGYILVGVTDGVQALGINDFKIKMHEFLKGAESEIQGAFVHHIQKNMLFNSKNPPHCSYQWVISDTGGSVLMIHVSVNHPGNVTELGPGDIYVRRGGSDLRATAEEIRKLIGRT